VNWSSSFTNARRLFDDKLQGRRHITADGPGEVALRACFESGPFMDYPVTITITLRPADVSRSEGSLQPRGHRTTVSSVVTARMRGTCGDAVM
jgi:hypothetical protein